MAKGLYIVDGHWQIFRAYYAPFRSLTSTSGEPTRATYVFTTMMLKLIAEQRPEHLAVAMDSGREGLQRTRIYPQYKLQRSAPPEDFAPQVSRIVQIIQAMGVPILAISGAEADDIMATAVRVYGRQMPVFLVSRDKDLEQLLDRGAVMYDPTKDEFVDATALLELKGYSAEKAVQVQALCGDATDNVPGVPGIGPKTAAKLIMKYGTIETVLAHLDELTPKLAQNLREHAADIELSRKLVTLNDQVPIELDLEKLRFGGIQAHRLRPIFRELDFGRILEQLGKMDSTLYSEPQAESAKPQAEEKLQAEEGKPQAESAKPQAGEKLQAEEKAQAQGTQTQVRMGLFAGSAEGSVHTEAVQYRLIDTPEALEELAAQLRACKRIALDAQTTTQQPMYADLVGISFSCQAGQAAYVPLGGELVFDPEASDRRAVEPLAGPPGVPKLDIQLVRQKLAPILADPSIEKVGHDLKPDWIALANHGMPLAGAFFDTMLAAYVLDSARASYRLDNLAGQELGFRARPAEDLIGRGKAARRLDRIPAAELLPYAGEDADLAFRLRELLDRQLREQDLHGLFADVEMALLPALVEMERAGIRIDPAELDRQRVELSGQARELRERIIGEAGRDFNPDSPRQLAEVLYQHLNLPALKQTKTGPSTDSSVLIELAALHPVPGMILEYRQMTKLIGTYLVTLGQCRHARTGRVHTIFHQTGTETGRLSSSHPNLQNIPIRTDLGRRIRSAFIAEPGNVLLSADYSQVELRLLAHFCQDETLMAAFQADQDIHRIVAAEVFKVPLEQVTAQMRARAKTVNFGIIYGQTAFGLAGTLRIGRREAQEFIDAYKARFPQIQHFLEECIVQAKRQGYVCTIAGRRRKVEGFDSANPQRRALAGRLAINSVVQGSAADLIKLAMIRIHRRLAQEQRPSRMLLQIHDELVFETPAAAAQADGALIVQEMTSAMQLRVPLKVELGVGPNWRDAK